ncbi:transcription factor SRM1-like [Solanum dulcamara]|uniref:transcription factor SRM1-like n=1 Tax=Solanum dulcamara TaxID=45834 RepID=UPI002486CAA8|nr:transcription factor SRM1-like [Solanum dulcamara]
MAEILSGKSRDDIMDRYNILIEDLPSIESGLVPLPNYPKMQSNSNQKSSKVYIQWRTGTPWTKEEYRTPTQVATHAQKFFKHLNATKKWSRKSKAKVSILDIVTPLFSPSKTKKGFSK